MSTRGTKGKNPSATESIAPASPLSVNLAQIIDKKLAEQKSTIETMINKHEERIMQRFSDLTADITNMSKEFQQLAGKIKVLDERCDGFVVDIDEMKATVSAIENNFVASDIVIINVPKEADAAVVVKKLAENLGCAPLGIKKVFRTHNNDTPDQSIPIIVKFNSPYYKVKLFRAMAEFRKINKRQVMISDLGLKGERNVVVKECLSTYNRLLLKSAMHFKRNGLLFSVFTLRGQVFVRAKSEGKPIKIRDVKSLNHRWPN